MSVAKEFQEFAMKGNVVDMAVGIIIGGAFGKIVSSIVNDIIMPPIGLLIGGVDFKNLKVILKAAELDPVKGVAKEAVTLNYGQFIQTTFDFTIVAFAIFLMIKGMNSLKKKPAAAPVEPPKPPPRQEILLTEIRDILKKSSR